MEALVPHAGWPGDVGEEGALHKEGAKMILLSGSIAFAPSSPATLIISKVRWAVSIECLTPSRNSFTVSRRLTFTLRRDPFQSTWRFRRFMLVYQGGDLVTRFTSLKQGV